MSRPAPLTSTVPPGTVHKIKERTVSEVVTRCGERLRCADHRQPAGVTAWPHEVTCLACGGPR